MEGSDQLLYCEQDPNTATPILLEVKVILLWLVVNEEVMKKLSNTNTSKVESLPRGASSQRCAAEAWGEGLKLAYRGAGTKRLTHGHVLLI